MSCELNRSPSAAVPLPLPFVPGKQPRYSYMAMPSLSPPPDSETGCAVPVVGGVAVGVGVGTTSTAWMKGDPGGEAAEGVSGIRDTKEAGWS